MSLSNIVPLRRGAAALALTGVLLAAPMASAASTPESFAPLVNKVKGAVVNIATTQLQTGARENELPDMPNFPPNSPLGELFKNLRPEQQRPEKLRALGSGFIIDPAGYVVTNNHAVGIGFAIPSNAAQPVIAQLRATGKVERGWLGVQIQPVTPDMANALGLKATHGALIAAVQPNSPAAKAGLKQGDVVTRFGSDDITSPRDLSRAVAGVRAGTATPIHVCA